MSAEVEDVATRNYISTLSSVSLSAVPRANEVGGALTCKTDLQYVVRLQL